MPPSSESATLPRGFRFHCRDGERPKTPEASSSHELQQPSPPRGQRLKIKRRNVSQFSGPTEQFLASVAAADIPIPTIETSSTAEDVDMADHFIAPNIITGLLSPKNVRLDRMLFQTPDPPSMTSSNEAQSNRRDWYMDTTSSPDVGLTRPSSSLSSPSDWSEDSYSSMGRVSRPSVDSTCTSPDELIVDPFVTFLKVKDIDINHSGDSASASSDNLNGQLWRKSRKDAPWSKEMSDHLWQTYQVYLQDPTVTPFRIGASAVPPDGVVYRVAREAKRSWKGPKSPGSRLSDQHRAQAPSTDSGMGSAGGHSATTTMSTKSGSITPTNQAISKIYIQWQHSGAATRTHLRELCRRKDSFSVQKHRHLQSRSPTPFSNSRVSSKESSRSQLPTPQGAFSTKDIAMSLATSTSVTMQPDGLLAKLNEPSRPSTGISLSGNMDARGQNKAISGVNSSSDLPTFRLSSPFTSRSYGPSTSKGFSTFSKPEPGSATGPRLRSPMRFKPARSLNGTQKRRAQHALEDELSQGGGAIRPSILDEQLFGAPLESQHRRVRLRGFSLGEANSGNRIPELFRTQAHGASNLSIPNVSPSNPPRQVTPLLPSADFSKHRWRSTLSQTGTSNTFPRRQFQQVEGSSTIRKGHFATVHHMRHSIKSFDVPQSPSLQSRLSQLDDKLTEIRHQKGSGSNSGQE